MPRNVVTFSDRILIAFIVRLSTPTSQGNLYLCERFRASDHEQFPGVVAHCAIDSSSIADFTNKCSLLSLPLIHILETYICGIIASFSIEGALSSMLLTFQYTL
jgi:hypothetical protein